MAISQEEWIERFGKAAFGARPAKAVAGKIARALVGHSRLQEMRPEHIVDNVSELAAVLGVEKAVMFKLGMAQPSLFYAAPASVAARLRTLSLFFGITERELVRRALVSGGAPLKGRPERLIETIKAVGVALSIEEGACRGMFLRGGSLLELRADTIIEKALWLKVFLDLEDKGLVRMLVRKPMILAYRSEAIAGFVREVALALGTDEAGVKGMLRRWPQIISTKSRTAAENAAQLRAGFGLSQEELVRLLKDFPALLYLRPQRVVDRHLEACERLGLTVAEGREIALRCGRRVLGRDPRKLAVRMRLVARIGESLGENMTPGEAFLRIPQAASYGVERLLVRYGVARLGLWNQGLASLLGHPAEKTAGLIEEEARKGLEHRKKLLALLSRI